MIPDVSNELLARGEAIVTHGDAAANIPACSSCHGPHLTGMEPAIPGLLGLRATYISAQLGAWRYGTRTATAPDCMQIVAGHLTEEDVKAIAAFLASRPAPPDPSPAPQGTFSLPLLAGVSRNDLLDRAPGSLDKHRFNRGAGGRVDAHDLRGAEAKPDASLIAKGEYLARAGDCIACHTAPEGKLFAGGLSMPTPFGTLYTSNITPDRETGIGTWTGDQFYATMHLGRFPDGGLLYPAMPFGSYTKVTRADSDAIFAYLQTIPPVRQPNRPHDLKFPFNNRSLILGWRTLFFKEGEYNPDPSQSAEWNRGAYLVEGLGPLRHVPHGHQRVRRQLGIGSLPGRPHSDAKLVRPLAHLKQRGRAGRLEPERHCGLA
jgi:cytochrome c553